MGENGQWNKEKRKRRKHTGKIILAFAFVILMGIGISVTIYNREAIKNYAHKQIATEAEVTDTSKPINDLNAMNTESVPAADLDQVKKEDVYASYKEVVEKKEEEYGTLCVSKDVIDMKYLDHVSYLDLIDFDQDGIEELLLCYVKDTNSNKTPRYCFEIYRYDQKTKEANLILSEIDDEYSNECYEINYVYVQEKLYLQMGGREIDSCFYSADASGVIKKELELTFEYRGIEPLKYYKNGTEISESEYKMLLDIWNNEENVKEEYMLSWYLTDNYEGYSSVVSKINETRKKLGLKPNDNLALR